MTTKCQDHPQKLPLELQRDYRVNLLLNDKEEEVWRKCLEELQAVEGRKVHGTDLARALVMPFLERKAKAYGIELNAAGLAEIEKEAKKKRTVTL